MKIHELVEKIRSNPRTITAHIIAGLITIAVIVTTTALMIYIELIQTLDQAAAFIIFTSVAITLHIIAYTEIMKRLEK